MRIQSSSGKNDDWELSATYSLQSTAYNLPYLTNNSILFFEFANKIGIRLTHIL